MKYKNVLGAGMYGKIYQVNKNVAVKVQPIYPKEGISSTTLMENDIMLMLAAEENYHPNIIKCLGVRTNDKSVQTFMEKCEFNLVTLLPMIHSYPPISTSSDISSDISIPSPDSDKKDISAEGKNERKEAMYTPIKLAPKKQKERSKEKTKQEFKRPTPREIIRWIYEIFSALSLLHKKHIIHGDLKFENIMLAHARARTPSPPPPKVKHDDDNSSRSSTITNSIGDTIGDTEEKVEDNLIIKIIDFGVSQHVLDKQQRRCFIQTAWFRAPEVILGNLSYDERVDMWSMGVIMLKLIFDYIISTEEKFTGKTILDYTNVLGVPDGEDWKKLVQAQLARLERLARVARVARSANIADISDISSSEEVVTGASASVGVSASSTNEKKKKSSNSSSLQEEEENDRKMYNVLEQLLVPSGSLDQEYEFNVWLKRNIPEKYNTAVEFFGQENINHLVSLIRSCLSLDPTKRLHSAEALKHPLFSSFSSSSIYPSSTSPSTTLHSGEATEKKRTSEKKPWKKVKSKMIKGLYQDIITSYKANQEILGCHENTILIAIDNLDRLFSQQNIITKMKNYQVFATNLKQLVSENGTPDVGTGEIDKLIEKNNPDDTTASASASASAADVGAEEVDEMLSPMLMGVTNLILAMKYNQGETTQNLIEEMSKLIHLSEDECDLIRHYEFIIWAALNHRMITESCRLKLSPFINYF